MTIKSSRGTRRQKEGHPGHSYNCRCWAEPVVVNQFGGNRYLAANELADHLEHMEGNIPHMYLDTNKNVTVGRGILLENVEEAAQYHFKDKNTDQPATMTQLISDFNSVKGHYKAGNGWDNNIEAHRYASITQLRLSEEEVDRLAFEYINETALSEISSLFLEFDSFPLPAQIGLLDMIYNLGHGGLKAYTNMKRAIDNRDWRAAAAESGRDVDDRSFDVRNEWTRKLFEEAAEIEAELK